MAVFGLDYYSLVYALVGTILLLSSRQKTTRLRALIYVALSTIAGAALGTYLVGHFDAESKPALFVVCMVCGGGAQLVFTTMVDVLNTQIKRMGGQS
jgi:uncharacterized membrane protein YfcA